MGTVIVLRNNQFNTYRDTICLPHPVYLCIELYSEVIFDQMKLKGDLVQIHIGRLASFLSTNKVA